MCIRDRVYAENCGVIRRASESDLNLMLMRSTRAQKVGRRGVHLTIGGERLDYWSDELLFHHFGEQVYLRYDPENLKTVRIYTLKDEFIMTCEVDNQAVSEYGASAEDVKAAVRKVKTFKKVTKEAVKASTLTALGKRTALELVIEESRENMSKIYDLNGKVVELHRAQDKPLAEAVGSDTPAVVVDIDRMIRNAEARNNSEH